MVEVARLSVEGYLNAVAWNKDGSRLAALSGFGNYVTVWDAETWEVARSFTRYGGVYSGNSLSYLSDGSLLLPAPVGRSPDPPYQELFLSSFEQIDPDTGKRIRYVEDRFYDRGRRRIMETFSVSQGSLVAGIAAGNPALVSLFGTQPWSLRRNLEVSEGDPRRGFARSLSLSPEGSKLAIGTANGHLKTFDTETGRGLLDKDFSEVPYAISATAFSRDEAYIAIGRAKNFLPNASDIQMLRILNADTLEDVQRVPQASIESVYSLSWGPDWRIALAASNVMEVATLDSGGSFRCLASYPGRDFYSVSFSPMGQLAAAKGSTVLIYDFESAS